MNRLRTILASGAIAAGATLLTANAALSWNQPNAANLSTQPAPINTTNLDLVNDLDAVGKCLFRSGVYSSGGVGFEDSALPYDSYPTLDAALATYRAELIRRHADVLGGVDAQREAAGQASIKVAFVKGVVDLPLATDILTGVNGSSALIRARATLEAAGLTPIVNLDAESSILSACAAQDFINSPDGPAALGVPINVGIFTTRNEGTGRLEVHVPSKYVESAAAALKSFGAAVLVHADAAEVEFQGRKD